MTPARVLDTRYPASDAAVPAGRVPANGTASLDVLGRGGLPTGGVSAAVGNLTVVGPAAVR